MKRYIFFLVAVCTVVPAFGQTDALIPFRQNDLWGYCDSTRKLVIEPIYEFTMPFQNGVGVVGTNGKYGFVDSTGKLRAPVEYQIAINDTFSFGLIRFRVVTKDKRALIGFMDNRGRQVVKPQYINAENFSNGLAMVMGYQNKYGFIDTLDNFVISPRFDFAIPYTGTHIRFKNGGYWGLCTRTGQELVPPQYEMILDCTEGLAAVQCDGKWGYVNVQGKVMIEPMFEDAAIFSGGLAKVRFKKKWGYINYAGEMVIEAKYNEGTNFSENMAAVKTGAKWGYINNKGETIIAPTYDYATPFSEGLACVRKGDAWGMINKDNVVEVPLKFTQLSPLRNGVTLFGDGTEAGLINRKGEKITKRSYTGSVGRFGKYYLFHVTKERSVFVDLQGNHYAVESK